MSQSVDGCSKLCIHAVTLLFRENGRKSIRICGDFPIGCDKRDILHTAAAYHTAGLQPMVTAALHQNPLFKDIAITQKGRNTGLNQVILTLNDLMHILQELSLIHISEPTRLGMI